MSDGNAFSLANVQDRSAALPDRIVLYADPGWGKTSFATRLPAPIFLLMPGEDRLKKLIEQGLVPPAPHFPTVAKCWGDVLAVVDELTRQQHAHKTFVLDTGNGAERLAQEQVAHEHFEGDWGEKGFSGFGRGEKIAADEWWMPLLNALDRLREVRRMRIVLLCHKGIVSVKNPEGADYDKIGPALSKRAWDYTKKWCDMILYGALEMQIAKDEPRSKLAKNKAKGGRVRLLHTQPTAAFEAKNVHRLPPTIRLGDDHTKAYELFRAAFPSSKEASNAKDRLPAESPVPKAETPPATKALAASLQCINEWMSKLRFTPTDREKVCAQHGLQTIEQASEEQARRIIDDLALAYEDWRKEQQGREPGSDDTD